ncbi:prolyl aminopeptidase [Natronosporangium hydrolyticum]|uniref:Proline iminopeptidase n=1 Tax=Natronosporangium hydrolyticum TaxID=2811111 RepID=A0A895Y8M1_9ACTN|nr:prolyl aminopeptidase [Natronosporangium hydrolyticum]QSB12612.1 prolyl aminopeptidase [Natronosporangium hydrolyticum]
MSPPYPPIDPFDNGLLDVGDGNHVYWEVCGNPRGKPALVVHGGPGSGCSTGVRRAFDPKRYRIILFDQRGCGRSRPHASDPATDLRHNTTAHLIADMERLRTHLGVDQWLLFGGSWGSTLILAYAQQYPQRVSQIVIPCVTVSRRSDLDWLYRGVGTFFPEQWARFRDGVPPAERGGDLLAAYSRLLEHPDPEIREQAAVDWCAWEDTVVSLEPNGKPAPYASRGDEARLALVRICAHYFSHGAWLDEGALLRDAHRLAGIPGALIHGRHDLGGPVGVAWELAQAWPDADLTVIEDAGHTGSPAMHQAIYAAINRFADG